MPPLRTDIDRSKAAPFKPPSRLDKSGASTIGARGGTAKSRGPASKRTQPQTATGRRSLAISPENTLVESGSDSNDEDDNDDSTMQQTRRTSGNHNSTLGGDAGEVQQLVIPEALLTRLLYEGFEDKSMKIGKEAMKVVGKYMETFVREAIARAALERTQEGGDDLGEGFLQVEDLEKLAPQLLLDF